ncbi:AMP-binding protein [Rhodobacteraceae bacterium N5(2021)]|uniref:AMP-binding protein n=1 Tax=Gymnodinialimonas phycosphaerae TaxID=2841589 RepID=A0A975TYF6_9RHOB|nr:AMP-binding protein [Gymnodinialimonas phycosphaerae]MBY4893083.1 AMP-binding protein [Gymnodinialimonas phycosphaerae]
MRAGFAWDIPTRLNIADVCCDRWARTAPDQVAIRHIGPPDEVWTYGQLKVASDSLAAVLAARGVRRGDRVAILMAQNPRVLVAHLAAHKVGAVSLPLFTLFGEDALRYRLADSGAKAVIVEGAVEDKLRAVTDAPVILSTTKRGAEMSLDDAMAQGPRAFRIAATQADDPAVMIYTSGTTGDPKGVLHAHRFLYGHLPCMELSQAGFPQPGDVGWTPADWAWIGGLMDMALPCLFYGAPLISHRFAKFDPDAAFALMACEGVSNSFLPPTALRLMQQARVPRTLRLRAVGSGGEALGADLLDWGRGTLGCPINEFYGQTEANLVVAACDGVMDRTPGAMGLGVPGHEVAVLGPGDVPVAAGEVGEVCVHAPDPVMMLGYWNKPAATARKIRDGWLRTGDLATLLADGQMVFHSRDDDVITSAGYRIGPVEIEQALCTHPDVTLAAVVGQPDPVRTEVIVAHVVLRPGTDTTDLEETLKQLVRTKASAHMVPRRIIFADSLPMTSTGKILRRALR